jgi:hypothetical protein
MAVAHHLTVEVMVVVVVVGIDRQMAAALPAQ